jgi:ribosomal protein S18 acetylase RimI-like enzyme
LGFKVIIRKAVPQDTAAIVEIWKEFMDYHAARDRHFTRSADGHDRFADFISGRMTSDTSIVVVAERNSEVVGYCLAAISYYPPVFLYTTYGMIADLAVKSLHRRQGIGRMLVERTLAWFAECGIERVELRAAVSNNAATAFWRKMGFAPYVEMMYKNVV